MAGYTMTYEHPETRTKRFYSQLESGRFRDGENLSPTQRAYREGYIKGYDDAKAITPGVLLGASHPHNKAKIYAQELSSGKSVGQSLSKPELAFRSGYLQFMRDAAEAWRIEQKSEPTTESQKTEIQMLFDALAPEQQASLLGYAKGMLANSGKNFEKLSKAEGTSEYRIKNQKQ